MTIYIGGYDSRNDPTPLVTPLLYDEYVTVSTDSGVTFSPNQRIIELTSDSSKGGFASSFIGDYNGVAATNDFVYPASGGYRPRPGRYFVSFSVKGPCGTSEFRGAVTAGNMTFLPSAVRQ